MQHLCSFHLQLLDAVSAAVLFHQGGELELLYASDDSFATLERLQLERKVGPSLRGLATESYLAVPDVSQASAWPLFGRQAAARGFHAFYVFPLRFRGVVVGTLDVATREREALGPADLLLGRALADVAAVAIIQNLAFREADDVNGHLQRALTCRIAIEQAKGILAERHHLDIDTAFSVLRRYARDTNQQLGAVSSAIVDGTLSLDLPVADARQ